jgi:hypothetical protein
LTSIPIQRRHRLKVVAFDQQVARLSIRVACRLLRDRTGDAGPDTSGKTPRVGLPGERDANAALKLRLQTAY